MTDWTKEQNVTVMGRSCLKWRSWEMWMTRLIPKAALITEEPVAHECLFIDHNASNKMLIEIHNIRTG